MQPLEAVRAKEPENIEARKRHIEILGERGANDYCLMSRNSWVYYIDRDKEFLKSKGAV